MSRGPGLDPSGGSNDSMTLAVGHLEGEHLAVVDCLREITAPFDPDSTVDEFVQLLSRYGLSKTNGTHTPQPGLGPRSRSAAWTTATASCRVVRFISICCRI
jgi:hypothetical protein